MSTSKHIDKICMAAVALMLVITILFMCGSSLGITVKTPTMRYESTLFDTSYVHQIDIVMNDWDSFIETCENEEYASCTVVIDGESHKNVAIRAKGNTSLSTVSTLGSDRYSFKLEFDHYNSGSTLDGLDKLCLNNLIQDYTMMKDYIVYQMMDNFGVDSPLCSFAYITVNGEDWGLYLAVEGIEDSFLSRNYGNEDGDLYKPDSLSFGGGRGNGKDFNMDDFDFDFGGSSDTSESSAASETEASGEWPGDMGGMMPGDMGGTMPGGMAGGMGSDDVKLKYIDDDPDSYSNIFSSAKTIVTTADENRLIQSLKNLSEYKDLENTVDIDEVVRYFVVHNFVCNGDSYTGSMIHNYYLYESDGVLSMIPWDYNLAYGTFQGNNASDTVNTSIDSPISGGSVDDRPMLGWIFSDETYTEMYHEIFAEFIEKWFADGELAEMISETAEMIRPYVEKDPTKFCTTAEFDSGVSALTEFVTLRAEAVSRQLEGDTTKVETGTLNLNAMGTMNNGGGMGGGTDIPGMQNMNLLSFLTIKDAAGNAVDFSSIVPSTATIASVALSDGTSVSLTGTDMQALMNLDVTKIVSVTDAEGNVYDLSAYTISRETPTVPGDQGENQPGGQGGTQPGGAWNMNSEAMKWILLGVSVLVLGIGVLIAVKKKY